MQARLRLEGALRYVRRRGHGVRSALYQVRRDPVVRDTRTLLWRFRIIDTPKNGARPLLGGRGVLQSAELGGKHPHVLPPAGNPNLWRELVGIARYSSRLMPQACQALPFIMRYAWRFRRHLRILFDKSGPASFLLMTSIRNN